MPTQIEIRKFIYLNSLIVAWTRLLGETKPYNSQHKNLCLGPLAYRRLKAFSHTSFNLNSRPKTAAGLQTMSIKYLQISKCKATMQS